MRFRNLLSGTVILVLVMVSPLHCGVPDIHQKSRFKNYSLREGLSQGNVYHAAQDSVGFIWIGTQDGLNRFDGFELKVFNHDPYDSTSLSDKIVNCIEVDSRGYLWIGTNNGLNRLSPFGTEFKKYFHHPADTASIGSNVILDILQDSRGDMWIATGAGLERTDTVSGFFYHFRHRPGEDYTLSPGRINSLFEDSGGNIWICSDDGLNRLDTGKHRFYHYRPAGRGRGGKKENSVSTVIETGRDSFMVGTGAGLFSFDAAEESFSGIMVNCVDGSSYHDLPVEDMCRDGSGRIWVATVGFGVFVIPPGGGKAVRYCYDQNDPNSLSYNVLNCIFQDRSEVIWIGTRGYGLSAWSPYFNKFARYTRDCEGSRGMSVRSVRALYEHPSGNVWVGGYYGLERLDSDKLKFFQYDEIPVGIVYVLEGDPRFPDSLLWVGTEGRGLIKFDIPGKRYKHFPGGENSSAGLNDRYIYSICPDGIRGLYIGTSRGISRLDFESGRFEPLDSFGPEVKVRSLMIDSEGSLWAGSDIGLAVLRSGSDRFEFYRYDPANRNGISYGEVLCVREDSGGTIWAGTAGGGLSRLNRESGKFRNYTESDGLPNNVVYGILEDERGKLWVSTNEGIASFDPETELFRCYGMEDGLQSKEFNSSAYHRGISGNLYFGGIDGFNIINPLRVYDDPHSPPVEFTGFKLFNRTVAPGDTVAGRRILHAPLAATEKLELNYRDKIITFEFAALNFTSPSLNQYAYRLEGLDDEWNYIGNLNHITFTSLQPGDYRLVVKAANADGVWNEKGSSIKISVSPPFWGTATFRVSAMSAILIILVGIYRIRTASIRRHNADLDRINERLEKQIADRIKVEKALRESEQKYWSILDNLEIGVSLISPKRKVLELNSRMKELFPDIGTGSRPACYMIRDQGEVEESDSDRPVNQTLSDGGVNEAVFHIMNNGKKSCFRVLTSPVKDHEGSVIAAIELVEDITEKERMEERLRNSQKMEAIGNLAGGIAHDFNNLLFAILGYAHLARNDVDPESYACTAIQQIETAGERAADLVEQILVFSRNTRVDKKAVRMDEPVREVISLLEGSLPSTVEIRHDIKCSPLIFADPARIHQVLMNVCTNAYQAMTDQAGILEIYLDQIELSGGGESDIPELKGGKYARLVVRDNGEGMDKDVLERIFEPYFTTREDGKGSGFGLTIVHGIVKGMNGDIEVSSEPGRGTVFEIYFPVTEDTTMAYQPEQKRRSELCGTGTILFVDDEGMITGMVRKYLTGHGYTVRGYTESREALDDFNSNPDEFDLIISDVTMPGITGIDLAERIRDKRHDIPIILLTGYSERLDKKIEQNLKIAHSLKKPLSLSDLVRTVHGILSRESRPA